jgi:hypothetical protein
MNRQQTTDEEEAFELIDGKMVLRDQHKYVVPMRALDAMQRDIARTFGKIHDGPPAADAYICRMKILLGGHGKRPQLQRRHQKLCLNRKPTCIIAGDGTQIWWHVSAQGEPIANAPTWRCVVVA